MKVVFVYPDLNYFGNHLRYPGVISLGIAYLSSSLKSSGHETSLIHIIDKYDPDYYLNILSKFNPQVVAFSSFTHQFKLVKSLAKLTKENFKVITICGGIHPSIAPEECIKVDDLDIICQGEGEEAIVELCDKLEKNEVIINIKNLWIKENNKIYKNSVRPLEENLDKLPFPDRLLYDYYNIWDGQVKVIQVLAGRGCPYDCSYCCNHQYKEIYKNSKYVRFRSPRNVIAEIKEARIHYKDVKFVNFLDDTFCLRKDWLKEFLPLYKKEINLPFHANTRINLLDDELMKMLKDGGAEHLALGIESGNVEIREKILNRKMTNQKIIEAFNLGNKHDVKLSSYNMLGNPYEGLGQILETIKLNAKINPHSMHVSIFQPYPYTKLYDLCKENNLLGKEEVSTFFGKSILKQDSLTGKEVDFAYFYFKPLVKLYKLVYKLPGKFSASAEKILDKFYFKRNFYPFYLSLKPFFKNSKKIINFILKFINLKDSNFKRLVSFRKKGGQVLQ
ncbi:MAG: B12-binding domain-containing radical SAM protein [Armatimonadetes bacterium]|nr:B12-binding domain-containing radical SAM protein [Armatimonadota bacterium]